jgi:hypothetical protein
MATPRTVLLSLAARQRPPDIHAPEKEAKAPDRQEQALLAEKAREEPAPLTVGEMEEGRQHWHGHTWSLQVDALPDRDAKQQKATIHAPRLPLSARVADAMIFSETALEGRRP